MNAKDILKNILETETTSYLAALYDELNCWRWPSILGECPFSENALMSEASMHIRPLRQMIINKIGEYEIFKYLHCTKLEHSSDQFEKWWNNRIDTNITEDANAKKILAVFKSLLGDEGRINQSFDKETLFQEHLKIQNSN